MWVQNPETGWVAGAWVQKASGDSFFGLISEDLLCAGEKGTGQNPCPGGAESHREDKTDTHPGNHREPDSSPVPWRRVSCAPITAMCDVLGTVP